MISNLVEIIKNLKDKNKAFGFSLIFELEMEEKDPKDGQNESTGRELLRDRLAFQKPKKPKTPAIARKKEEDPKRMNSLKELLNTEEKYCLNLKDIIHVGSFFQILKYKK